MIHVNLTMKYFNLDDDLVQDMNVNSRESV